MTISRYPAIYRDKHGEERTTITNDGKYLRMTIRGIEFVGMSFDLFDPPANIDKSELEQFTFYLDALCAFEVDCDIPVHVVKADGVVDGNLHIHMELGEPDINRPARVGRKKEDGTIVEASPSLDKEILVLELTYQTYLFKSGGVNFYAAFDEQFTELKKQLPPDVYLKTCWNCAFSDYHPVGSGSFGGLGCFRNMKEEYQTVKDKYSLMHLWDKRAENVQEIFLCPEFEKRQPGVGGLYVG